MRVDDLALSGRFCCDSLYSTFRLPDRGITMKRTAYLLSTLAIFATLTACAPPPPGRDAPPPPGGQQPVGAPGGSGPAGQPQA